MSIVEKIQVGILGCGVALYALIALALSIGLPIGVIIISYYLITQ